MTTERVAARRRPRAQVMVLGCVSLLILGVMLALSFNLTQAVHEKIRLQQHSDSMAYSMATLEARTMNYVAYTNRTMAAAFVSMMTAHAYMSVAGLTVNILRTGQYNFFIIAVQELAECLSCCPFCCVQHCVHAGQAVQIAFDYGSASDDYADKIKNRESDFNDAIKDLSEMVKSLHGQQNSAIDSTQQYLQGHNLQSLTAYNAPQAQALPNGVGSLNVGEFACALEGSSIDGQCSGRSKSSASDRSKIMANVANASRPSFPRKRFPIIPMRLHNDFWNQKLKDLQQNTGTAMPLILSSGCGRLSASAGDCSGDGENDEGKTVSAADDFGMMFNQWNEGTMILPFGGTKIASDTSGNTHDPSAAHQGSHTEFQGIQPEDVCTDGACFTNFRSNAEKANDYGQPRVYAAYKQDLRLMYRGGKGNWEITDSGKLSFEVQKPQSLSLVPQREGMAVSKAMVYFHRFDTWKAPPNLFDPYWRAKLHPFTREEMRNVVSQAGFSDTDATSGPIEGLQ